MTNFITCDWNYEIRDVNEFFNVLHNNVIKCIKSSVQTIYKNIKKVDNKWFNFKIRRAIIDRDNAYKKFIITGSEADWNIYKCRRNKVNKCNSY